MTAEPVLRPVVVIGHGHHPCEQPGCPATVPYDDEPFCFGHSPDHGSYQPGYSYRAAHPGQS